MKNEQEPKRFMTMCFMGSKMILPQRVKFSTDTKEITLEELKEELIHKKVFSSIKNGALNNTLREQGLEWEPVEEFKADYGDFVYEIQVAGVKRVYEYSDSPKLPEYCTLMLRKISVYCKED